MKKDVSIIIFDFDGVIVDSGRDIANAVNYALRYFGRRELAYEQLISYVGRGVEHLIGKSFEGGSDEIIKKAIPVYKNYYLENCIKESVLYPDVKEILEYFRDKKIALVTNKPEDLTLKILDGMGVRQYFNMVVGPESVSKMKPNPEGLLKVIGYFGEEAGRTIMVGDSYTDIEAGKNAGTYTCGVTYGLGDVNALTKSGPDFIVDDIKGLTEFIK
ncbi:MAG: HAD-IA family hydrolase [Clostridia bacterium]|nr:HAD-IA family hydrolase [Clostridia bacterium]